MLAAELIPRSRDSIVIDLRDRPIDSHSAHPPATADKRIALDGIRRLRRYAIASASVWSLALLISWLWNSKRLVLAFTPMQLHGFHLILWLSGLALVVYFERRGRYWLRLHQQDQESLRQAHQYTQDVIDCLGEGLFGVDLEGRLTFLNPAAQQMLGWSQQVLKGRVVHDIIHHINGRGTHLPREECPFLRVMERRESYHSDREVFIRSDGISFPVEVTATPMRLGGTVCGSLIAFRDISERMRRDAHIHHMAHHDHLTGLPNRAMMTQLLERAVAQANRYNHPLSVLFVDLDNFSLINNTMGHSAGDELLNQAAERMRKVIRDPDTLARQGGDEFIVLLHDPTQPEEGQAISVARRLLAALESPFQIKHRQLTVTASIGISILPGDARTPTEMLQHADTAMYHAKNRGKNGYSVYSGELSTRLERRQALDLALHTALPQGELSLHYQPLVRIEDRRTVGYEALLRWHNEELGQVPPNEFIPVAEENGQILPIGHWVLQQACQQAARWHQEDQQIYVAVNVSLHQLLRSDLERSVLEAIRSSGIPAATLELEITESTASHDTVLIHETFQHLHQHGVRLSLDDFGTGYSSLSRLKQLPINTLKVDKSFVDGIPDSQDDMEIVDSTIQLAHGLKKRSLAEGVESEQQHRFLQEKGCQLGQGYLYGKPAPAERLE